MASVNKVILIGNLGATPEAKFLPSGQAVCELRIATTDVFNDKQGQRQERTEWHRVNVWGPQAENCAKYLQKGRQVYVEGSLRTRSWDDKETGQKRYATEVVAQKVVFLGQGQGQGQGMPAEGGGARSYAPPSSSRPAAAPAAGPGSPPGPAEPPEFGPGDDDIPF